jgi:hypothetical protein
MNFFTLKKKKRIFSKKKNSRKQTVIGSSINSGISACFKKTFPRQTLHNIRSNATIRSRGTTPVINLFKKNILTKNKQIQEGGGGHKTPCKAKHLI